MSRRPVVAAGPEGKRVSKTRSGDKAHDDAPLRTFVKVLCTNIAIHAVIVNWPFSGPFFGVLLPVSLGVAVK